MQITALDIEGPLLLRPARHGDARGWFRETWKDSSLKAAGIADAFVQDNEAFSAASGTLRGLHFQRPPHAQVKLVRCVSGRILDVAVDIRRSSPSYGRHVAVELGAEDGAQLYVPEGFAHGYVTLTPDCLVAYKVSGAYAPAAEGGLLWSDAALGIPWPGLVDPNLIKPADRGWPRLADLPAIFD